MFVRSGNRGVCLGALNLKGILFDGAYLDPIRNVGDLGEMRNDNGLVAGSIPGSHASFL